MDVTHRFQQLFTYQNFSKAVEWFRVLIDMVSIEILQKFIIYSEVKPMAISTFKLKMINRALMGVIGRQLSQLTSKCGFEHGQSEFYGLQNDQAKN